MPRRALAAWLALLVAAVLGLAIGVAAHGDDEAEAAPWTRVASMSQRRSYIAAARLDGQIYTAGGMVGETGRPLALVSRYAARADRWEVLRRLPEATRAAAGAALGGRFYVIGGTTADGNTGAVWAFDPATGAWTSRAPLPEPRFNHAAVALGGRIWVLGGYAALEERRDVFVYDPRTDRWQAGPALPRPMHAFGAVAFRGELWVIGGRRGEELLREVWILNPRTGRWRAGPPLPKPMELLGATVAGDEIHVLWESTYQVYDARTGRWRQGPPPTVTRHALQLFRLGGGLYAVGGCTTALHDSPVVEYRPLG
ncbi:MAG: Kelch repeat-containing protein [Pseudomonadota bacterium]